MSFASIIIRTKNEDKMLPECLAMISKQDYKNHEIIFVDSGSTDQTLKIIHRFQSLYNNATLIQIRPQEFTYGYALNLGCKIAKGEIIISLSAHALPISDNWLSCMVNHFSNEQVAGVCGGPEKMFVQNLSTFTNDPYFGFDNANSAFRKRLWEEHPFNESMLFTEDKEWEYYFLNKGYITVYAYEARVNHVHQLSLNQIYVRSYREHHGFAQFLPKEITRRMLKTKVIDLKPNLSIRKLVQVIGVYIGLQEGYKHKAIKSVFQNKSC